MLCHVNFQPTATGQRHKLSRYLNMPWHLFVFTAQLLPSPQPLPSYPEPLVASMPTPEMPSPRSMFLLSPPFFFRVMTHLLQSRHHVLLWECHASLSGMCLSSMSGALSISKSDLLMVHCSCTSGGQLMGPNLDLLGTIFTFKSNSHGGEFRTGGDKLESQ